MRRKLTVKICRDVKPDPDHRFTLWDTDVGAKGLGLRVSPNGHKVFVLQYRRGRQVRKLTLGELGDLTLEEARKLVARHRRDLRACIDPAEERQEFRGVPTVRELWTEFTATLETKRSWSTLREYETILRLHVAPALGSMRVTTLSWSDVARLHAQMGAAIPVQANAMLKCGARVFDYGARMEIPGLADRRNPFRGHDRHPEKATAGRAFSRAELAALGAALPDDPENFQAVAVRLTFLSGMRPGEVIKLAWEDLSEDCRIVRLPASKTGPRVAYLGATATEWVRSLPCVSRWLFPSRFKYGPMSDCRYIWNLIRDEAEVQGRLVDARHTFGTVAEEILGIPRERTMALMGHSRGSSGVHGKYIHRADLRLLADADRVAAWIEGAMAGEEPQGEVVPFARSHPPAWRAEATPPAHSWPVS